MTITTASASRATPGYLTLLNRNPVGVDLAISATA